MPALRPFLAYCATLGCVLLAASVVVHLLMAREYRLNVTERLAIVAHDGEEAMEHVRPGSSADAALGRALDAPDEGLVWFDTRDRRIASSGMTQTHDASVEDLRVHERRADGWIRATVANQRITNALRQLDLGLAIGTSIAMLAGGLIVAAIAARSVARVEEAYRRVFRFTGDAAHELRTPLAVIANNADRLAFASGDDLGHERSLANIRQAALQMRELMNGLLILARAEEGVLQDLHAIDVKACVEAVARTYRPDAAARGLALSVRAPANQIVYGQPEQVARIVGNLVENALRHTPAGGSIEIACTAERSAVAIAVTDTGSGIDPQSLEHVFDRFWRAKGAPSGTGSGLGLAIARSLAQAHGGDISVKSRVGEGSTFTVRLPLRPHRVAGLSTVS